MGLAVTEEGKVWFGAEQTVGCYDPGAGKFRHYRDRESIFSFYTDTQNRLWVGSYLGLRRYDPLTDRFEAFPGPPILGIAGDSRGNLWLGHLKLGTRLESGRAADWRGDIGL